MTCVRQQAGTPDLYFYEELPAPERLDFHAHLRGCAECRRALEDLRTIRAALAGQPDIAEPAGGDWSRFTSRLEAGLARAPGAGAIRWTTPPAAPARGRRAAPWLGLAAMLALVTASVLVIQRERPAIAPRVASASPGVDVQPGALPDPALLSVSDHHFQRSKLVLLGLATMDTATGDDSQWAYERALANSLLDDTRLYRLAAETRGMPALAGVMRDLEVVLLEAAMSDGPDRATMRHVQDLIRRRDLLTRMDVTSRAESPSGL
jgi:hypothetical protein